MSDQHEPEEVTRLRRFKAVITAVILAVTLLAVFVIQVQLDHPEARWPRLFWLLFGGFGLGLGAAAPLFRKWLRKD